MPVMVKPTPVRTRTSVTGNTATHIEEHLEKLQDKFDDLKVKVRQAQQLASLGTAAATIAHEVNNLLTPMLGYAEYAVVSNDTEFQKKALTRTIKNVRRLIKMTDRILRLGAATETEAACVSVRALVDEGLESLCRDLRKDGINVEIDVPESLCVLADAADLEQVLFNLFLNARQAMAERHGGRLTITAQPSEEHVTIAVHNTGDAIAAGVLPTIFDTLATTKPTTREGKARCRGLGLALCRELMEENDGAISVTSTAEGGTTFRLTLPAAEGDERVGGTGA